MTGRVLKSTGSWYEVLLDDGRRMNCRTRGKLRLEGFDTTNPIAVGDQVRLAIEGSDCTIQEIYPRTNYIIRQSVKKKLQSHIIAANMDQAALIVTMSMPRTSTGFIDRFLITAEAYDIPQALIFNKTDLLKAKDQKKMENIIEVYEKLGIPCIKTSAVNEEGLTELRGILNNKTTLLSGHSGVGKSSLLNLLSEKIDQDVKEISSWTEKGLHTTTFAEMFILDDKTFVIDTPGIKELGLVEMEQDEIKDYFPEMHELQSECKFHNCTHTHEPNCAVKKALEAGGIAAFRYKNYLSMLEGDDSFR